MSKSILLLGATGLVGGECLKLLHKDESFERIVVLSRSPIPDELRNNKVEEHLIDFDNPESYQAFTDVDAVISALGTTIKKAGTKENFRMVDYYYPLQGAEAAFENGATCLLLVSSSGANINSPVFYNKIKGELEKAVCEIGYRSICIFRPSLLIGQRKERRRGEETAQKVSRFISFAIPDRYKPIGADSVAFSILQAAKKMQTGIRILENDEMHQLSRTVI